MVVARSPQAARDAVDLIEVEFEEMPAIIGFERAMAAQRAFIRALRAISASISNMATPPKPAS